MPSFDGPYLTYPAISQRPRVIHSYIRRPRPHSIYKSASENHPPQIIMISTTIPSLTKIVSRPGIDFPSLMIIKPLASYSALHRRFSLLAVIISVIVLSLSMSMSDLLYPSTYHIGLFNLLFPDSWYTLTFYCSPCVPNLTQQVLQCDCSGIILPNTFGL